MPKNKTSLCKLGAAYIEAIHDELVQRLWPGTDPIARGEYRNPILIESSVGRPFQTAFGEDAYPSVTSKAIALFHSLNSNHCFFNGNKRTAVIALDHFLVANDHVLLISNADMYKLAEQTASYRERGVSHEESFQEITAAIKGFVADFRSLRQYNKQQGGKIDQFLKWSAKTRKIVRTSPLNSILPSPH